MEVVKRGTPSGDLVMMGECRKCKSTLKAAKSELKEFVDNGPKHEDPSYTGVCPVCHCESVLFEEQAGRV